ncbi:MAG: phosphate/phosphite/phosphonate ABC transporter substrate-binding protein [Magnetococcales bacterium]|nr:phosphate/phosphite/phosphonate ABC transporter substrate-binding protein [Magnetococcales bacterium]
MNPLRIFPTVALGIWVALGHVTTTWADETLVFGIHPFMRPTELLRRFSPLTEALAKAISHPIRIRITSDYDDQIRLIGQNQIDLAYMGPVPYVRMVARHGLKPILGKQMVHGQGTFQGVIITRRDSAIQTLPELIGKRFAFGDPNSTMSHLVPRAMLLEAGVPVEKLARFDHLSNHGNVALGVLMGLFDAGAIKESVFLEYQERGLTALAWTPRIANHLFVTRSDLPTDRIETLRTALLQMPTTPEGLQLLKNVDHAITGIEPGQDDEFSALRTTLRLLDQAGVTP